MKQTAPIALLLTFGVASAYAHENPVRMTFSGTSANSTINLLQPNSSNDEDHFAGNGTLGSFTYRQIRAISNSPAPSVPSSCSGSNLLYLTEISGGGIFRFHDGSLLYVQLTEGSDCIDLTSNEAHCTLALRITGGTGRFKNASGTLGFTETVVTVLVDASNNPVFFAATGEFTGTLSGVDIDENNHDER